MHKHEVQVAFEILLTEVDTVADDLRNCGAQAFKAGELGRARETIEMATRMAEFRAEVTALQQVWSEQFARVMPPTQPTTDEPEPQPDVPTPQGAYRRPILEALVESGGSAPLGDVLDRVGAKMRDTLNPRDYEPLPTNPNKLRWRDQAQWCRNGLVGKGYMKGDSPWGIWEISDRGREALLLDQV